MVLSTKAGLPLGDGPGDLGTSRSRLIDAVDAALTRLDTDYIDLFQLHAFDAATPFDEVVDTLDDLVRSGKVRYTGVSNFSGWQLMGSLAAADRRHRVRHIAHQVYYSLVGRDYEWDSCPWGPLRVLGRWCGVRLAGAGSPAVSAAVCRCRRRVDCTRPPRPGRPSTTTSSTRSSTC
ncbi:hypothetical protein GCM10009624_13340 [Gordonia sinesedis]